MENIKVGYYSKPFDSSFKEVDLSVVLKCFGNGHFKAVVDPARQLYADKFYEEYTLYKNKLPAVTFSGTFRPKRTAANIEQYSSLIILDIDKVGENLLSYKKLLGEDPYVIAVWLSPSGDGLKFIIASNFSYDKHKMIYQAGIQYFQNQYGMNIDKSGSDVSRLCFVSSDSDIRINKDYKFSDQYSLEEKPLNLYKPVTSEKKEEYTILKRDISNEAISKLTFRKIYHYLNKRGISITNSYEDWVRVAFAISNTFSYSLGYDYFMDLCRLDGSDHDELASIHLINSCYAKGVTKSSFSTILFLCKQKGYDVEFNKRVNKRKKPI